MWCGWEREAEPGGGQREGVVRRGKVSDLDDLKAGASPTHSRPQGPHTVPRGWHVGQQRRGWSICEMPAEGPKLGSSVM